MVLGSSVYAFATMLAAFLLGIALGSLAGRRWADRVKRPLPVYAGGLAALGLSAVVTLVLLQRLPDVFVFLIAQLGTGRAGVVATSVTIAASAMLAPTLILGALFPLITRATASNTRSAGNTVGDVYFVNTIGSALGAFSAGFLLIPALGLRYTMATGVALNLALAAGVLAWQRQWAGSTRNLLSAAAAALAVLVVVFPPAWRVDDLTRGVFRSHGESRVKRRLVPFEGMSQQETVYYRDGINTTISVHRSEGLTLLRVNGKVDASTGQDMSTQVLSGQIPMLFGPRAERVNVIGLASAVSVGSVALHEPSQVDAVEIEPAMVEVSHFFDDVNNRPLERPNVRVIGEDGRTLLTYTTEQYDVIVSEPSNPWITGASNLFTREFFANVRRVLRPDGRFLQWLQLYESDATCSRAILAALRAEFPYVYGFLFRAESTDMMFMAMQRPLRADDLPRWNALPEVIRNDLRRVGLFSGAEIISLIRLTPADIDAIVGDGGAVNSDDNMYVELRSPWSVFDRTRATENQRLMRRPNAGALPLLPPDAAAEEVGALALAYVQGREEVGVGEAIVREATARGDSPSARVAAVEIALQSGDLEPADAVDQLSAVVAQYPDAFAPRLHRARLLASEERYDEALDDADAALRAQPGDLRARYERARTVLALGRAAEAHREAQGLLASPFVELEPEIWSVAGEAAAAAGQMPAAVTSFQRYLELNPNSPTEWSTLATVYAATGDTRRATEAATNEQRARRNTAILLHEQARAFEARDRHLAIQTLKVILHTDPTFEEAHEDLTRLGVPRSEHEF
jgi:spermidine synthase